MQEFDDRLVRNMKVQRLSWPGPSKRRGFDRFGRWRPCGAAAACTQSKRKSMTRVLPSTKFVNLFNRTFASAHDKTTRFLLSIFIRFYRRVKCHQSSLFPRSRHLAYAASLQEGTCFISRGGTSDQHYSPGQLSQTTPYSHTPLARNTIMNPSSCCSPKSSCPLTMRH